jgi:hypothetical protein
MTSRAAQEAYNRTLRDGKDLVEAQAAERDVYLTQAPPDHADVSGQIAAVAVVDGWPGPKAWVLPSKVAAVVALKEHGPTRLVFSGGGHLDVCGGAEWWRCKIRIAELEDCQRCRENAATAPRK